MKITTIIYILGLITLAVIASGMLNMVSMFAK